MKSENIKVFITGATGNVGSALISSISENEHIHVSLGTRNIEKINHGNTSLPYKYICFDYEKMIYPDNEFDVVFLVRPPHIADPKIFERYLATLKKSTKIVFLSVKGAEHKSYLPHAKIEKLIQEMNFKHVFIRPSYFMENLLTTLWDELKNNNRIFLPSGHIAFNWVSVQDIAKAVKHSLIYDLPENYIDVCNYENHNFYDVVKIINEICNTHIQFESPNLFKYVIYNLKKGEKISFILVMLLLHYLPKFQKSEFYSSKQFEKTLKMKPISLESFIKQNKLLFQKLT